MELSDQRQSVVSIDDKTHSIGRPRLGTSGACISGVAVWGIPRPPSNRIEEGLILSLILGVTAIFAERQDNIVASCSSNSPSFMDWKIVSENLWNDITQTCIMLLGSLHLMKTSEAASPFHVFRWLFCCENLIDMDS